MGVLQASRKSGPDPNSMRRSYQIKQLYCRLLFWCKQQLRDKYKLFPKGMTRKEAKALKTRTRKWRIWAVFSEEVVQDKSGNKKNSSSLRTCYGPLGTECFVTWDALYGFVAASKAISILAHQ